MNNSKVYFTTFKTTTDENLLQKLARLIKTAGMTGQIDFANQYAAIKIHFGEPGNLAFCVPTMQRLSSISSKHRAAKLSLLIVTPCMSAAGKMPWTIWMRLMPMASALLLPAAM